MSKRAKNKFEPRPSDFFPTPQAAPFLPACTDIVTIGRAIWIDGTDNGGYDNFAWYRFDTDHTDGPRLHWTGKAEQAVLPLGWENRHTVQAARGRP